MATKKLSVSAAKTPAVASALRAEAATSPAKISAARAPAVPKAASTALTPAAAAVEVAKTKATAPATSAASRAKVTAAALAGTKLGPDLGKSAVGNIGAVGTIKPGDLVVNVPPVLAQTQFTRKMVRPRDLLVLDFTFVNLQVRKYEGGLLLERTVATKPAYIVVGFPSQHLLEEAFFESADPIKTKAPSGKPAEEDAGAATDEPDNSDIPVRSRLADASRLVFRVPADFTTLPYTLDAVLDACQTYELNVAATATPPDPRFIFLPGLADISIADVGLNFDLTSKVGAKKVAVKTATVATRSASKSSTVANRVNLAKISAAQAYTATAIAEAHDQWYAARSPLQKIGAAQADIGLVTGILDKIKILPKLAAPTAMETAIEAPARLILSPNSFGAWVHATQPVESTQSGRVELWHTRLAVRASSGVTEAADYRRAVRAIWSPDAREEPFNIPPHSNVPFRAPLDALDRHNIVHLSANFQIPASGIKSANYKPIPVDVDRLMLSSLGAWMNVRGAWTPPIPLNVEEWINRGTMGRDHYVKVVYAGALYPFGHKASLIKVTERKFHSTRADNAAFLRQRMFIVVREPYRLLGNTNDVVNGKSLNRGMPLKSARLTTLVTPNLDDPAAHVCSVVATTPTTTGANPHLQSLFWPYVAGEPFPFHVQFEDESGALINITMPLFFLGNDKLNASTHLIDPPLLADLASRYTAHAPFQPLRRRSFSGQRVQLAPSRKMGDTSFEINQMEFSLTGVSGRLVPGMISASASIPSLKHLARNTAEPEIKFPDVYLKSGLPTAPGGANPGEVFLELVDDSATKLDFSTQGDRSGGFLAPNLAITGLSRVRGPIGGAIDAMANNSLKPADFFKNLGDLLPKLFGCIKITDILPAELTDPAHMPKFLTESLTAAQGLLNDVAKIQDYLTTLNGQLAGLGTKADALAGACADLAAALGALLADPADGTKRDAFKAGFTALNTTAKDLRSGFAGLSLPEDVQFAKTQLDQLLGKFVVGLEAATDVVELVDRIVDTLEALNEQRIKFEWKPPISDWGIEAGKPIFEVLDGGGLVIAVELAAQSGTSKEPSFDVACRLQKFDLNLIAPESFLKLHFNKIEFTASSHSKPDVNVDFGGIEFVGILSFVETLRTMIPLDGFSDPPALSVSEQGIEASFSLGLPNIAVGVFSLSNLSLGAALTVPFVGQEPLSVRFNFCERSDPFRLTVWIFGGGGFFAVTVTPAGVQILEAAFEFGAAVSLDFGVASGSVSVMAGIYFKIEGGDASLTGYFHLNGRVSVLGLIHASLDLNLELSYEFSSGKCVGRASLVIEVEVLFFSASVTVSCEKKFAGSNGDPSFLQIMAPYDDPDTGEEIEPWPDYCEAFAS